MNARNPIDGDRRTHMTDAVGTTAWRYDEAGRLVGESGPFGTPEVQVAYDPNGRLTNVTWGTFSVDYAFDDLGRIVAVAAPEGTYAFTYLSNGLRRATVAYPNGVIEVRVHDELTRCISLTFLSGTNDLLSIAYAYDDGDRRTNEVWSTGRAMAYGYDDAHQLTSVDATRPSDAARYRYDAAGNPVDRAELGLDVTNTFNNLNQIVTGSWTGSTVTVAGSVNYPVGSISVNNTPGTIYPDSSFDVANVPVAPGTNTLVATYTGPAYTNAPMTATDTSTIVLGDTLYTHDANGNLTSDATFLYQYDLANQLTNVIRKADNTTVLQCRYDALGRRVEAIRSDGTVDRYVYFPGTFLVLAVLDGSNNPKEFYTRGPDLSGTLSGAGGIGGILACTYASGPVLYHHADLMGSVIALTDSSSILTTIFRYTPFGNIIDGTSHKYMHQGIGWLQRKSVQLIVNGMATIIDDFVDDMNHFDFRRKIDSKVKSFEKIKMDALEWLRWAEDNYECCVNGQIVPLTVFPGVLAGDKDLTFGVAHCAFGVLARQRGISFVELLVANVAWEGKEFVDSEYWEWMPPWMPHMKVGNIEITPKKGLDGWMRDTLSDILLVEVGYVAGDSLEYCIPKQCYRKHMEQ